MWIRKQQTKILIDTAGGMRNISIMMQTMTRVLQYYGYQTAAYYTNFSEKRIFCDHTDRQIAIMEALAEFAQHGTVRKLRDCFRNNRIPEISSLLDAIQAFSDSMQLCRTQDLPAIINERIFPLLDRIDGLRDTAVSQEDVAALRQMTDYIRIQFGYNPLMPALEITPVDLIRWCLKNDLIQQAVTLFTENIPKYLIQTGLLQVEHPEAHLPNGFNTQEASWLYTDVIESCWHEEPKDLDLLECAALAALPQSPDTYALAKAAYGASEDGLPVLGKGDGVVYLYNGTVIFCSSPPFSIAGPSPVTLAT